MSKNIYEKAGIFLIIPIVVMMGLLFIPINKAAAVTITSQLGLGNRGTNVTELQRFLGTNSMIYPSNLVTGYFGPLTREAVIQFQISHNLPGVGRVGPQTLAVLNGLLAKGNIIDISAPQITAVSVNNISSSGVTISWTTNEGSKTNVFYNSIPLAETEATQSFTEPQISGSVMSDNSFTAGHSFNLTGLQSNTTYYYVVESIDSYGNVSVSTQETFKTL